MKKHLAELENKMNQIEYDSFYKFLVSIGIILLVLPIILFVFILKEPFDLLVTTEEIQNITTTAQQIIYQRQYIISILLKYSLIICIFFYIAGVNLIVIGSKKWYEIQIKIDKKQELEYEDLLLSISKMTDVEKLKKLETDIAELESEKEDITNVDSKTSPNSDAGSIPEIKLKPEDLDINLENILKSETKYKISEYFEIESKVYELMREKYSNTHILENNIRLGMDEYDILAISKNINTNSDIIFETKYLKSIITMSSLFRMGKQLKERNVRYYNKTNRTASLILVIVAESSIYEKIKEMVRVYRKRHYDDNVEIKIINESFKD